MNFELGAEQLAIVEAVDALLARHAGAARAIEVAGTGAYDFALDAALAEAGFFDVATSAATGLLDAALLVEEVARAGGVVAIGAGALVGPGLGCGALTGPVAIATADATGPIRFAAHARTLVVLDGDVARVVALGAGAARPVRSNCGVPMGRVTTATLQSGDALGAGSGARVVSLSKDCFFFGGSRRRQERSAALRQAQGERMMCCS